MTNARSGATTTDAPRVERRVLWAAFTETWRDDGRFSLRRHTGFRPTKAQALKDANDRRLQNVKVLPMDAEIVEAARAVYRWNQDPSAKAER